MKLFEKYRYHIALLLLLFSSWVLMFNIYIPSADDFLLRGKMLNIFQWILERYEVSGIRRSFVFLINGPICNSPESVTNFILFSIHLICVFLVFYICFIISKSRQVAFISAVFFGVYPFGYGAVTWACGSYIIPHIIFILLAIIFFDLARKSCGYKCVIHSSVGSFLLFAGCLVGEHLVLSSCLIGIMLFTLNSKISWEALKKGYIWLPFLVVGLYLISVLLTQKSHSITDPWGEEIQVSSINISTVFSVWLYSFRFLWFFQPLFNPEAIFETINQLGVIRISIGLFFLICACFIIAKKDDKNRPPDPKKAFVLFESIILFSVIICMMIGLSLLHAIAGGYSASSRHHYAALLFLAFIFASMNRVINLEQIFDKIHRVPLIAISVIGVVTSWATTAIDRYELQSYKFLYENMAANNIEDMTVGLNYSPPIYHLWPNMRYLTSHPLDEPWVLNFGLSSLNKKPITIDNSSRQLLITIDRSKIKPELLIEKK